MFQKREEKKRKEAKKKHRRCRKAEGVPSRGKRKGGQKVRSREEGQETYIGSSKKINGASRKEGERGGKEWRTKKSSVRRFWKPLRNKIKNEVTREARELGGHQRWEERRGYESSKD